MARQSKADWKPAIQVYRRHPGGLALGYPAAGYPAIFGCWRFK
jgi:hypothetical protein